MQQAAHTLAPGGIVGRDDLVGAGNVALIRAARRYQPSDVPFRAYAWPRVRGAMLDELRSRAFVSRDGYERGDRVALVSLDEPLAGRAGATAAEFLADPRPGPGEIAELRSRLEELRRLPARRREAILRVACGETQVEIAADWGVVPSYVCHVLAGRVRGPARRDGKAGKPLLTPVMLDVLRGAARGEGAKETAARTGRSVETVKQHRKNILRRLEARNITHAVWLARRTLEARGDA